MAQLYHYKQAHQYIIGKHRIKNRSPSKLRASLLFTATLMLFSSSLYANNAITWQTIHFPPLSILKGPDKGSGQLDHFLPYLQQQLPQYKHYNAEVNWARIFKSIKHGKEICSNMVFKTAEREKIAIYTVPVAVALPFRIIMSKANKALIGNPSSYSLEKLITDKRFKGAFFT